MANKRMFSLDVIDSDSFMEMPLSTQALYIHLSMRADDEGFVKNPRKIQKMLGASDDDLRLLITKQYVIPFDSGIIVISHWKVNNNIRSDRFKSTTFIQEKSMLIQDENNVYIVSENYGIPSVNQEVGRWLPQVRLGKDSINNTHTIEKAAFGSFENVFLSDEEYAALKKRFPKKYVKLIEKFSVGLKTYGYEYENHYAAILKWEENDRGKGGRKKQSGTDSTFDASEFDDIRGYTVPDLSRKKAKNNENT